MVFSKPRTPWGYGGNHGGPATSKNVLLLVLLYFQLTGVRGEGSCGGLEFQDNTQCDPDHYDGIPMAPNPADTCSPDYNADCCLAVTGFGETPTCNGEWNVHEISRGGAWITAWTSYACCKTNDGAVAGVIVGAVVGFLCIAGIIARFTCCKPKTKNPKGETVQDVQQQQSGIQMTPQQQQQPQQAQIATAMQPGQPMMMMPNGQMMMMPNGQPMMMPPNQQQPEMQPGQPMMQNGQMMMQPGQPMMMMPNGQMMMQPSQQMMMQPNNQMAVASAQMEAGTMVSQVSGEKAL